jgi:rubrerythrin
MKRPNEPQNKSNPEATMSDRLVDLKTLTNDIGELTSMREILQMAIRKEDSSYGFYLIASERSCNRMEKELFLRLAKEELLHKQNLERQLEEVEARTFTDRAMSSGEISDV